MAAEREAAELRATLPRYVTVGDLLRSGGTARVYRGVDTRRDVEVTIKVLDARRRDLIETEGRALARLAAHPAIVQPVALGSSDGGAGGEGLAWIVTDLAAHGSLWDHPGSSSTDVLAWASQLADALAFAHSMGVVHGDVKPANVLLDERRSVRLADFGSAVLRSDARSSAKGSGYTPRFAAPERGATDLASEADDIYGFASSVAYVLGDGESLPPKMSRLLQRCLGPAGRRPDARRVVTVLART